MIYKIISTVFLLTSASVGGGIIAQPILINKFGIIPNAISLLIAFFYTYISSFIIIKLYIESNKEHYFSMFEHYIGRGNILVILIYLFICLFSLTSYYNGIKEILLMFDLKFLDKELFFLFLMLIILLLAKKKTINLTNNFLEITLICLFFLVIFKFSDNNNIFEIKKGKFSNFALLIPIFITSLSYQILLPNIINYLNKDEKIIKLSVFMGLILSVFFFLIWNFIIINSINIEDISKLQLNNKELELYICLNDKKTENIIKIIILLILITSMLGIGYGTKELLKDILKIKNDNFILFIILICIIINSKINENKFVELLEKTSIYGEIFLNGIIPSTIYVKIKNKKKIILLFMIALEIIVIVFNFNKF